MGMIENKTRERNVKHSDANLKKLAGTVALESKHMYTLHDEPLDSVLNVIQGIGNNNDEMIWLGV